MSQSFVAFIVGLLGLHMLVAALRHRALAEAWIGLFFVSSALGSEGVFRGFAELDPTFALRMVSFGIASLTVATVSGYAFTYTVFRRGEPWARGLVVAGTLLGLFGAWYQLAGPTGTADIKGLCVQFLIGRVACFAWGTYEALRAYAMAHRRLALGLADPIVVNRFLLFGVWFAVMGVMPMTLALTRMYGGVATQAIATGVGPKIVGTIMAVALVLTFFPPRKYLSWVAASAQGAQS